MDIRQQILHFYRVEELSLREISRRAGADRKTVTRLINAFEAAIKENPETGIDEFLADDSVPISILFFASGFITFCFVYEQRFLFHKQFRHFAATCLAG